MKKIIIICFCLSAGLYSQDRPKIVELIEQFSKKKVARGEVLYLVGQVLGSDGKPILDTAVEIWQTDSGGAYDHSRDSKSSRRDRGFQFFGKSVTDGQGWYAFRTILPGEYSPRPRHIHFKVKRKNRTLLTSQFYFSEDKRKVENEKMFRAVGEPGDSLLLPLFDFQGKTVARGQVYIKVGGAQKFEPTPSQAEGPFYPEKSFADMDNDLLVVDNSK